MRLARGSPPLTRISASGAAIRLTFFNALLSKLLAWKRKTPKNAVKAVRSVFEWQALPRGCILTLRSAQPRMFLMSAHPAFSFTLKFNVFMTGSKTPLAV